MPRPTGFDGVDVARHNPNLDHGACLDVIGCSRRDCDGVGGFVYDVHLCGFEGGVLGFAKFVGKLFRVRLALEPFNGSKGCFVTVFVTDDCRLVPEGNEGGFKDAIGCFHGSKVRGLSVVRNIFFALFLRT